MAVGGGTPGWAPSGPAQLRAIAAILAAPGLGALAIFTGQPDLGDEGIARWSNGGYFAGGAVALAIQAVLLVALVQAARRHRPGDAVVLTAALIVWCLSAFYILVPFLAIFAFLGSAIASVAAVPLGALLCLVALVLVLQARAAGAAPSNGAAVTVQAAGWIVAVFVMPAAGGGLVLVLAGTGG